MRFPHGIHASEVAIVRIVREIAWREFSELWRELARPVTLFDEASPAKYSCGQKSENSFAVAATRPCHAGHLQTVADRSPSRAPS